MGVSLGLQFYARLQMMVLFKKNTSDVISCQGSQDRWRPIGQEQLAGRVSQDRH